MKESGNAQHNKSSLFSSLLCSLSCDLKCIFWGLNSLFYMFDAQPHFSNGLAPGLDNLKVCRMILLFGFFVKVNTVSMR